VTNPAHKISITDQDINQRLDHFLTAKFSQFTRSYIQQLIAKGHVLVNDTKVKSGFRLRSADSVYITIPEAEASPIRAENIPLDILFEDEELIIINKPAGMVVHPGISHYSGTLVNALYYHFQELPLFQSGEIRPGLVHRIDKDTTGLLVVAKTEYALNHLANQFFHHTIERKYQAIIWGIPEKREDTIEGHIGRSVKDRKIMQVFRDGSQGKPAVTHFKVLEDLHYISLVECSLETGRTHQIRVHFASIKHPIFGDEAYGGDQILRGSTFTKYKQFVQNCFKILPRQALHAKSLGFIHPESREKIFFDSDLPEDMKLVLEKWRKYKGG